MATEFKTITPGQILIFLGPSLPLATAQPHLPEAFYLPPARCGDVLLALRLKPKIIGIVDGFFEHTAAIWHKEILFALEQGVTVIGASSMGALRAAELADSGMLGVGKIFHAYREGQIIDDDEVAVLHQNAEHHYLPVTDALVNIRATLESALAQNILSKTSAIHLINTAKQLHYRQRTFAEIIVLAQLPDHETQILNSWLQDHYIDQKKLDAIALLTHIQQGRFEKTVTPISTQRSIFFRNLYHQMMSSPFSTSPPWLPESEKIAFAAQRLPEYPQIHLLARLLELSYQLAATENSTEVFSASFSSLHSAPLPVKELIDFDSVDNVQQTAFLTRLAKINNYLAQKMQAAKLQTIPDKYLRMLLQIMSSPANFFSEEPSGPCPGMNRQDLGLQDVTALRPADGIPAPMPGRRILLLHLATLWWLVEQRVEEIGLELTQEQLQQSSDQFRRQRNLLSRDAMDDWLRQRNLSLTEYQELLATFTRLNLVLDNFTMLGVDYNFDGVFWLGDALIIRAFQKL